MLFYVVFSCFYFCNVFLCFVFNVLILMFYLFKRQKMNIQMLFTIFSKCCSQNFPNLQKLKMIINPSSYSYTHQVVQLQPFLSHTLPYITKLKTLIFAINNGYKFRRNQYSLAEGDLDSIFELTQLEKLQLEMDHIEMKSVECFFKNLAVFLPQLQNVKMRKHQLFYIF